MGDKKSIWKTKPKVLVDTSFLLPAIGISVEKEILDTIKYFQLIEVYYLEVCISEAMWIVLKVVSPNNLDVVREGIEAIRDTYKQLVPPSGAYIKAYEIYRKGHKDYIDDLIYATSLEKKIALLTTDYKFINFLKENNYPIDNIITPRDLKHILAK